MTQPFEYPTLDSLLAERGLGNAQVVTPTTLDELSAALKHAHAESAAVIPWGGGTKQTIGLSPQRADMVVCTRQLNNVLIHEPADLTISVETGMTIGALQRHLAQYGQMLPLDAPLPEHATIGGLIAAATDGPRRLGYGTLRDLLIGVTVVEANGRISKGGGMVVKNVSGFDMMKLYLGSFGTLAVVAVANFKLLPLPTSAATIMCRFGKNHDAFAFLDALNSSQLVPVAAEYLNAVALNVLEIDGHCGVAVRTEGSQPAVDRHIRDVGALATQHHAASSSASAGDDHTALWQRIADLPQTALLADDEAVIKLSVLPGDLANALDQLEALTSAPLISARALNGVAYARLQPADAATLDRLAAQLPGFSWAAATFRGGARWGTPAGPDLMRRIKQEFDPHNNLNPGRFVIGQ